MRFARINNSGTKAPLGHLVFQRTKSIRSYEHTLRNIMSINAHCKLLKVYVGKSK